MHARMHKTVLMHVRDYQYKLKSTIFKFYFINVSWDRDVVRSSNIDFYEIELILESVERLHAMN